MKCGKAGLGNEEVSMSGDGWMCAPCFKAWDAAVAAREPHPWLHHEKANLAELEPITPVQFDAAKRRRALKLLGLAMGLAGAWLLPHYEFRSYYGAHRPALGLAAPVPLVLGAIFFVWGIVDFVRTRRTPTRS